MILTVMALVVGLVPMGSALADTTPLVDADPVNMTVDGVATQSSTSGGADASLAIDGVTNGAPAAESTAVTNSETEPWWEVDLSQLFANIPVVNVISADGSPVADFSVFVSDAPFASTDLAATRLQAGVDEYEVLGNANQTVTVLVGRSGRYVRVHSHNTESLELAEVQVGGPTFEIDPNVVPSWGVRGTYPSLSDNIDAEVFAIEQIGNMLYVGGRFQEAIPTRFAAGQDQPFLMALDATTGDFISTFRPEFDGAVLALEASPDGSRLFVGGEFYTVNDEPLTGGIVALDPVSGLVQEDWTSHLERYWTVGSAQVKNLEIAGGYLYAVGGFTHAIDPSGISRNVYNVARFDLTDSTLDVGWRPNVTGGTVFGVAADTTRNRVYIGGKFTAVDGLNRQSFAAIAMDSGAVVAPETIERNVPPTGQDDIYDLVAVNDLVVIAGSEHSTIAYDADDFSIVNWVFTNSPGGDNQDLEVVDDRIYSTCHCRGGVWDGYRPGSNWTVIAEGTYMGNTEGIYAISAKTAAFIDTFPYDQFEDEWTISAGPWAVHGSPDGCLWIGGDNNLTAEGGQYVNSIARVCLEGGQRALGLTTPTAPPPDTTAPPPPQSGSIAVSGRDVTISVTPPANTSDVAHYAVFRDGVLAMKSESSSILLVDQPVGVHEFAVGTVDTSGNQSAPVVVGSVELVAGSYERYVDAAFENPYSGLEYEPFDFELGVFGGAVVNRAVPMYTPDGAPTDDAAAVLILGGKVLSGTPTVTDMAGAFTTTFTLDEPTPVSIRLDQRMYTSASMGTLQAQVAIDGNITTLASISNNGTIGPWTEEIVSFGTLAAGEHTVAIGGNLSSKSYSFANWWNRIAFDDVLVYSEAPGLDVLDAPTAPVSAVSLPVTVATTDRVTSTSSLVVTVTPSWTGVPQSLTYDAGSDRFVGEIDLLSAPDGGVSYDVTATDTDFWTTSETVSFDVTNDAPPTVTIESPADGATVFGSMDVVVDAVDVFDPAGSLDVEVSIDGATWQPAVWDVPSERYLAAVDISAVPDGPFDLTARATDSDLLVGTDVVTLDADNSPPTIAEEVLGDGPVAYWRLGEAAGSVAVDQTGNSNGTYVGAPTLGVTGLVASPDTAVLFDGVNDGVDVPDSSLINVGSPKTAASVEAWFSAEDTSTRQVIYEQGGATRGAAIYLDGGSLYGGYWNVANDASADTPWASGPAFVSTPVFPDTTYHTVITFDQPSDAMIMYVDGIEVGRVTGIGTLYPHGSDIGIGAMNDSIRFHDGTASGDGYFFAGVLDEVAVYGSSLTATQVADHTTAGYGGPSTPPTVSFVDPVDGATVSGTVTVRLSASDAEEPAADLSVDLSFDGGISWTSAAYDVGSGEHRLDVDTTAFADGPLAMLARATDTPGLAGFDTIDVTTDNGVLPTIDELVAADGADAYWRLGESSGTTAFDSIGSLNGVYANGPILGAAGLVAGDDTAVTFDGVNDVVNLPDSALINTSTRRAESVEVWFSADDTSGRQVLYDQGGTSRGLNIYIDNGVLYVGGWNTPNDSSADTPWASGPAFVTAPVTAASVHQVVLVYDADADNFEGFLDGVSMGSIAGIGTLHPHYADNGIGAMNDGTRFHDGTAGGDGFDFAGVIDEVSLYPTALTPTQIDEHLVAGRGTSSTAPSVAFVDPVDGATVSGTVTVRLAVSDAEEPASGLAVDLSVDGGATWTPVAYDIGSGEFRLDVDTTLLAETTLMWTARATDTPGLEGFAGIDVTVDNVPPSYDEIVLADDPSVYYRLGESAGTVALDETGSLNGTYVGSPLLGWAGLVAGTDLAVSFDGADDVVELPDSSLLNTATRRAQTVELWFSAGQTASRQVLFDQGGTSRGLNVYIDAGLLYVGGWNTVNDASADTPWASGPAFVSTAVSSGTTYHVVLVYDADGDRLEGYLNGVSFGSVTGIGTLHPAYADNGIGAMHDGTRFHDGISGGDGFFFGGVIDEVASYDVVLPDTTIADHHAAG